jgi:hypothetical protein
MVSFGLAIVGVMLFETAMGERHYHTVDPVYPTNPPSNITIISTATLSGTSLGTNLG